MEIYKKSLLCALSKASNNNIRDKLDDTIDFFKAFPFCLYLKCNTHKPIIDNEFLYDLVITPNTIKNPII